MTTWHAVQLGRYGKKERIASMRRGVIRGGGKVLDCPISDVGTLRKFCEDHDVRFAFTCGMHWQEREARKFLESVGVPLVVMDLGYFKRAKGSTDRDGYNQVGIGRIGWVPDCEVDSSRWDALGIADASEPVANRPKSVLVLGQVPNDSQHGFTEKQLNRWFDERTADFRAQGYTVVFRPHPCHLKGKAPTCDRISSPTLCTLSKALAECSHVVTYNSTAGLEAILAGVPVVCHESAHYHHIRYESSRSEVMRHFHRLAWSQWTCDEIESGAPIRFLFPNLPKTIRQPMKHLIAIPYFGTNARYLDMLHEWVRTLKESAPDAEFLVFTHDAADILKPFGYPVLKLDIGGYKDVIRPAQPFDIKGALMCEAALNIHRPFLMLDADAYLVGNTSAVLDAMPADCVCAMPIDHGAILHGHKARCDAPFEQVRKMCAGVFWFGSPVWRQQLVTHYRIAWRELLEHDCPWTPRLPHLLEQYAWSLAHWRLNGATLPASFNWAPHIVGESKHAIVNHLFGHKKWKGKAPKNT